MNEVPTTSAHPTQCFTFRIRDGGEKDVGFYVYSIDRDDDFVVTMTLHYIEIYPAYRNLGHGSNIVDSLVHTAENYGYAGVYAYVDADNPDAQHFMSKFGTMDNAMDEGGRHKVTLYEATPTQ